MEKKGNLIAGLALGVLLVLIAIIYWDVFMPTYKRTIIKLPQCSDLIVTMVRGFKFEVQFPVLERIE